MKILEHTSTQLVLKDSAIGIWSTRVLGSIFLTIGCLALILFVQDIVAEVMSGNFLEVFPGIIFITIFIVIGFATVFFSSINTFCFDKMSGTVKIKSQKIFRTINSEYPIDSIKYVKVKEKRTSKSTTYFIVLRIESEFQEIRLSDITFMRLSKAQERADLIRDFLHRSL